MRAATRGHSVGDTLVSARSDLRMLRERRRFDSAAIGAQDRAYERLQSRANDPRKDGAVGGTVPEVSVSRAARSGVVR